MLLNLAILAAGDNTAVPPDEGSGFPIIAGVLIGVVLVAVVLWFVFTKTTRRSRGGVQPPPGESGRQHPGSPPLESIEPRS